MNWHMKFLFFDLWLILGMNEWNIYLQMNAWFFISKNMRLNDWFFLFMNEYMDFTWTWMLDNKKTYKTKVLEHIYNLQEGLVQLKSLYKVVTNMTYSQVSQGICNIHMRSMPLMGFYSSLSYSVGSQVPLSRASHPLQR